MSEKNKKVELNEEELSQVSGGNTISDALPEIPTQEVERVKQEAEIVKEQVQAFRKSK